jgi:hypothetical protein
MGWNVVLTLSRDEKPHITMSEFDYAQKSQGVVRGRVFFCSLLYIRHMDEKYSNFYDSAFAREQSEMSAKVLRCSVKYDILFHDISTVGDGLGCLT